MTFVNNVPVKYISLKYLNYMLNIIKDHHLVLIDSRSCKYECSHFHIIMIHNASVVTSLILAVDDRIITINL